MTEVPAHEPAPDPAREALRRRLGELEDLVGSDPARAASEARLLQERARALDDDDSLTRARVWEAEAVQRDGDTAAAAALVAQVRRQRPDLPRELAVQCSWILSRVFTDIGDRPTALEHALDAAAASDDDDVPRRLRTRVLLKVADLLDELGAQEDSRSWYRRAEELAVGDAQLHLMVVNNRAFSELELGDAEAAQREVDLLEELSRRYDRPLNANALDTVSRVHLLRGDARAAEAAARAAVETNAQMDSKNADDLPFYLLTLAAALRTLGDPAGASAALEEARACTGSEGFADIRTQVLAEQAEVFAALGDYRSAFEAHKAFHAADKELLSEQREAQARARQAVFETDVARREAARYREEARRDPLTGLRNRLFVDERLPLLVDEFRAGDRHLSAVLLDLDHFKSVNDGYSHEVGDAVLRAVAVVLEEAAGHAAQSFAARLGGEEFLVALVTDDAQQAVRLAEGVRARVRAHDWSATTPGRGVTVSAGVATLRPGDDKTSLLGRADERLYAAKAAGRDRVVAGPGPG